MKTTKQILEKMEKELYDIKEIKKQFFSDTSPDRDIEKWTSKEHNKWKVWNNERVKLNKSFRKRYGTPNLELIETKISASKERWKEEIEFLGEITKIRNINKSYGFNKIRKRIAELKEVLE